MCVLQLITEARKSFMESYTKIKEAALNPNSEHLKPAPDVSDAEWRECKSILDGITISSLTGQVRHRTNTIYGARWPHARASPRARRSQPPCSPRSPCQR